jgi:hypothetical protein
MISEDRIEPLRSEDLTPEEELLRTSSATLCVMRFRRSDHQNEKSSSWSISMKCLAGRLLGLWGGPHPKRTAITTALLGGWRPSFGATEI